MSEHASVLSAGAGLLVKRSSTDGGKGVTDTTENRGPFARHLSEAGGVSSKSGSSSMTKAEKSADAHKPHAADRQVKALADEEQAKPPASTPTSSSGETASQDVLENPERDAATVRVQDTVGLTQQSAVDSGDASLALDASLDEQEMAAHPETLAEAPSATLPTIAPGGVPSAIESAAGATAALAQMGMVGEPGVVAGRGLPESPIPGNADVQSDRGNERSNVTLVANPLTLHAGAAQPALAAAPTSVAMAKVTTNVRGASVHPLLAKEMSQRSTSSADVSVARPVGEVVSTVEDGLSVEMSKPVVMRAALQGAAEDSATLPEVMTMKSAQKQITVNAQQMPGVLGSASDGQAAGTASSLDSGAVNPTTNMFHAVASGTLTAAPAARMDTIAAPQLAPNVVHLQMGHVDGSLSENVRWVVDNNLRNVTVNVAPSGMGPVSINVVMESEQMNVSIVANQGATREALEAALPRLREQLAQQGNDQVRVDVSDGRSGETGQFQKQEQSEDEQAHSDTREVESTAMSADEASVVTGHAMMRGLVDAYA